MISGNYILDALYGPIRFPDYVWQIISCPEIQRLREVRLCNINSLRFTGGSNINRYEHSLGTGYLALLCTQKMWFGVDQRLIILAALLHDVGTAPFGHSVQYALELQGYEHEALHNILTGVHESRPGEFIYRHTPMEQIYLGTLRRLNSLLSKEDLKAIDDMIAGRGPFGPLISGSIDLDNVDNVYRLSYHMGLVRSGETPLALAQAMDVNNGKLVVSKDALPYIEEWGRVRKTLYDYLLLDQAEFSAKCMLQDALEQAQQHSDASFVWNDVDFELVKKLLDGPPDVAETTRRLMVGDLYGCLGIYSTYHVEIYQQFIEPNVRRSLEKELSDYVRSLNRSQYKSAIIRSHLIEDIGKSQRQVEVNTDDGQMHFLGVSSRRVLIGIFFKNVHLNLTSITPEKIATSIKIAVREKLCEVLKTNDIQEIIPGSENSITHR